MSQLCVYDSITAGDTEASPRSLADHRLADHRLDHKAVSACHFVQIVHLTSCGLIIKFVFDHSVCLFILRVAYPFPFQLKLQATATTTQACDVFVQMWHLNWA